MSLKVCIFEDDIDVAELLKDMLEEKHFEVQQIYKISDSHWQDSDVILGDYRNKIVQFELLKKECIDLGIPLIAISGAETKHKPQLLKPFLIEDLQSAILQAIMENPNKKINHKKSAGFLKNLFKRAS